MHRVPPNSSRWSDAKALWALCWRMVLLTPIVGVFGTLALVAVSGLTIIPPILVVLLVITADYLSAAVTVGVWLAWLRFGGPVRRFVFEGFEHGSL